ncbi:unnamed protein product [Arabis nemorensis]|uniref:Ubiquitin-like protease family profile domain-containing protein n=1 Tax=Arabis nemorensis TaxID=586526 RepID=A0A565AXM3_9BRAS|nr:unnamed protein product [Arabis nemorensis]
MNNLIFFLRDRFLEDFKGVTKPIDFMEVEFAVAVSKTYPNAKKKSYKIPNNVSKYVGKDRQWFTDVERLYCPYMIHGHWIGLCIDLSSHEITVLQPDPTKYAFNELTKELQPLAESLPFVITKCATNSEMDADMTKPFTITSYAGEWKIKRKGSHGITAMLLFELHASTTLNFLPNLDEASVIDVGKNYGV